VLLTKKASWTDPLPINSLTKPSLISAINHIAGLDKSVRENYGSLWLESTTVKKQAFETGADMKIKLNLTLFLILLLTACNFRGPAEGSQGPGRSDPDLQSQQVCGDQVCDGPETAATCPQDCTLDQGESDAISDTENKQDAADPNTAIGQIFLDLNVSRTDGEGSCGEPPWGVDHISGGDFSCVAPKYWYGYNLVATAFQRVEITDAGSGTWKISGTGTGGGTYQTASHWSDGERICEPVEVIAEPFDFSVTGTVKNGRIELQMITLPVEISEWSCSGGSGYERETTLLYLDAAIAMTGSYQSLASTLESEHRIGAGYYSRIYSSEMNPSPQNRDFAEVKVDFSCMTSSGDGMEKNTACPWEE
jgi:hypothetical protein